MSGSNAVLQISGRVLALVLAVSGAVALFVAATILAPSKTVSSAPSQLVAPAARPQERICAGPILDLGADSAAATVAPSVGQVNLQANVDPQSAQWQRGTLLAPGNPNVQRDSGPHDITTKAGAVLPGKLAASQSQVVASERLKGYAASSCTEAADNIWLVGGSTDVGRTTLLVVSNPSSVEANVKITVYGQSGPVDGGLTRIDARSQRVLSLSGIAPNLQAPIVHLVATGGEVVANLQSSVIVGVVPQGIDVAGATAVPAKAQTIPGFLASGSSDPHGDGDGPDRAQGDGFAAARIVAPSATLPAGLSAKSIPVKITMFPEGGGAAVVITANLVADQVTDIPVDSAPAGRYMIYVDSDAPIVAGVRSVLTVPDANAETPVVKDFAWNVAALPLVGDTLVAIPKGPNPQLTLANPGDKILTISLSDGRSVTVKPSSSQTVALTAGLAITLSSAQGIYASVSYSDQDSLGGFVLAPPKASDQPVQIYPR